MSSYLVSYTVNYSTPDIKDQTMLLTNLSMIDTDYSILQTKFLSGPSIVNLNKT